MSPIHLAALTILAMTTVVLTVVIRAERRDMVPILAMLVRGTRRDLVLPLAPPRPSVEQAGEPVEYLPPRT